LLIVLSSVDCIMGLLYIVLGRGDNIYLLVSTYYSCPFVFELPYSGWYFLIQSICLQNSGCPCF
jgi:predicted nucleic acid-binding Zn finger protein